MKSLLILLASLSAAVLIFIGGVAVAAYVISDPDPEPHRLANVDAPDLWKSRPVAVDVSKQDYERIEALPAIASLPASSGDRQMPAAPDSNEGNVAMVSARAHASGGTDATSTDAVTPEGEPQPSAIDPQHADWCFARYRSYQVEDDSYQPYGGGPRQQCRSPWTPMAQDGYPAEEPFGGEPLDTAATPYPPQPVAMDGQVAPTEQASVAHQVAPAGAHEEWCFARYRSYRVGDNSYQPMDGGARRVCSSPYG